MEIAHSSTAITAPYITVQTRTRWTDDWTTIDYLYLEQLTLAANPEVSSAVLTYRTGYIIQPNQTTAERYTAPNLRDQYVLVKIYENAESDLPLITWAGVVRFQESALGGGLVGNRTSIEKYLAFGLEALLEKCVVDTAYVEITADPKYRKLHRPLTFNGQHQKSNKEEKVGNRSVDAVDVPHNVHTFRVYHFAKELATAKLWNAFDIAEHLLAHHAPRSAEDSPTRITYYLDITVNQWYDAPILSTDGRSVKQLLDQLMLRQRGLGYTCSYREDQKMIYVSPFTFTEGGVTAGDLGIPGNTQAYDWTIDEGAQIVDCKLKDDVIGRVNRVLVRGLRGVVVCNLAGADNTLEKYWSTTLETAYATAGTDHPDYATADVYAKEMIVEQARAEARFERVFRDFGLPLDWDGMVGDGEGGGSVIYFADPDDPVDPDDPDDTSSPLAWYLPELRFNTHLPLRTETNYNDNRIGENVVIVHATANKGREFRQIAAYAQWRLQNEPQEIQADLTASEPDHYDYWLSLNEFAANDSSEFSPTLYVCAVRPVQDAAAVSLQVQGATQAVFAAGTVGSKVQETTALIDISYVIVTVAMPIDLYCQGVYPADTGNDLVLTQLVELGDRAQLIYVAPGTVVDVKNGELKKSTGGYLRDDRQACADYAQIIHTWYNTPRKQLTLTVKQILYGNECQVGRIIRRIGDGTRWISIATPITRITYTFPETNGNQPGAPTTTIQTDFANIDFVSLYQ